MDSISFYTTFILLLYRIYTIFIPLLYYFYTTFIINYNSCIPHLYQILLYFFTTFMTDLLHFIPFIPSFIYHIHLIAFANFKDRNYRLRPPPFIRNAMKAIKTLLKCFYTVRCIQFVVYLSYLFVVHFVSFCLEFRRPNGGAYQFILTKCKSCPLNNHCSQINLTNCILVLHTECHSIRAQWLASQFRYFLNCTVSVCTSSFHCHL